MRNSGNLDVIEEAVSSSSLSRRERESWPSQNELTQREWLLKLFFEVRSASMNLCSNLEIEDFGLQAVKETSPPKWHLAHTTWFFETFILNTVEPDYQEYHPHFKYLFNSYYDAVGEQFARPMRGLLTRPTVNEVMAYRELVDEAIAALVNSCSSGDWLVIAKLLELGCNHEEQHQELLLTDLKYGFSLNPLKPAYQKNIAEECKAAPEKWLSFPGGLHSLGHTGSGFSFDNERPLHQVYVAPYKLASRLVTNGEFLEFIEAGGYEKPEYWLSDGFAHVKSNGWKNPLYWSYREGSWHEFTLSGEKPLNEHEPVSHLSFYEAEAYARFRGKRLPTEAEWELAVEGQPVEGNLRETGALHPRATKGSNQFFGDVWEWTSSSYSPYPGYKPEPGAVGEYNGKFMANQMVLRGGSCVTPAGHIRATYRNFFYPPDRWQFTGLRLAE